MVLYFTGTGNSRYLARRIAEGLDTPLYDLNARIKAGDTAPVQTGQDVVLVTPTYAWRIPRVVSEWLGKTALTGAERNARIVGTKGSIFLPDFQHAETMTLVVEGKAPEVIRCPVDINGFEYEIREASRCVKLGRAGSDHYTPQDSLALTCLMYDTRMSWGMKFAGEV